MEIYPPVHIQRPSDKLENLLSSGGKIAEYHKHSHNDYYTVRVLTPRNEMYNFSNVSPDHMSKYLKTSPEKIREKEEAHRPTNVSFVDLMHRGGKIISYHPTQSGNVSLHVKAVEPDGSTNVYVFTNISREKFEQWRSAETVYRGPEEAHPTREQEVKPSQQPRFGEQPQEEKENEPRIQFEDSIARGGRITNKRQFTTYSVHIRTGDNQIEHYGNIHPGLLEHYRDKQQIEPNFRYRRGSNPRHHNRGDTFETVMKRGDAVIVDTCPHDFFSVQVQMPDGRLQTYSHVSKDRLVDLNLL